MSCRLREWLQRNYPRDVLMPVREGTKAPAFAHRHGQWTWARYDACEPSDPHAEVGVVLHDLCVVDVDSEAMAERLEARFPVLRECPAEKTPRGRHYWFARPAWADAQGYFDGAAQRERGVDFKSVTSTGTGGFVVVAREQRGQARAWIRCPWTHPPVRDMPADLLEAVAVPRATSVVAHLSFTDSPTERFELPSPFVAALGYLSALEDLGDSVLPVPCARSSFAQLLDVFENGRHTRTEPTAAAVGAAVRAADVLNASARLDGALCQGAARLMAEVYAWSPRHWRAMVAAPGRLVDVPAYAPCRVAPDAKWKWLLSSMQSQRPGPAATDDAIRLRTDQIPDWVVDLLLAHPGNLIVAGGAPLGWFCPQAAPGGDIDFFVVGLEEAQARQLVEAVNQKIPGVARRAVTANAVTWYVEDSELVVQVVLRLYATVGDVLDGFDLSPSRVAVYAGRADGMCYKCTPSWIEAVRDMAFAVDYDRWSASAVARLLKYRYKGFRVLLPGVPRGYRSLFSSRPRDADLARLLYEEWRIESLYRSPTIPMCRDDLDFVLGALPATSDYIQQSQRRGILSYILRSLGRQSRDEMRWTTMRARAGGATAPAHVHRCVDADQLDRALQARCVDADARSIQVPCEPCPRRVLDAATQTDDEFPWVFAVLWLTCVLMCLV